MVVSMSEHQSAAQKLNYRRILWLPALIFLCNPCMNLVDVLPDLFGYLLLRRVLRRASEIDESLEEARRLLGRLCWLQVARVIALYWATGLSDHERPTMVLTLTLVFGILELMQIYPLCSQLFHGLAYLGMRNNATLLLQSGRDWKREALAARMKRLERKGKGNGRYYFFLQKRISHLQNTNGNSVTDMALWRCCAFATVKIVLSVLPECLALTQYSNGFNFMPYIAGARILAMSVCTLVGVVWAVHMAQFCSHIVRDTTFWENVLVLCQVDEKEHPERAPYRSMRRSLSLMVLGGAFALNFSADGIGLWPTFLVGMIWVIALCGIRRSLPDKLFRWGIATSVLQAIASAATYTATLLFYQKYDIALYAKSEEMQAAWRVVIGLTVVEMTLLTLSVVVMSVNWCTIRARYCYFLGNHGGASATSDVSQKKIMLSAELSLIFLQVCALLCFTAHIVYAVFYPTVGWIGLVDVGVAVVYVVALAHTLMNLREDLVPARMVPDAPDALSE